MFILKKLMTLLDMKAYLSLNRFTKGYRSSVIAVTFMKILLSMIGIVTALSTMKIIDEAIAEHYDVAIQYGALLLIMILAQLAIEAYVSYKTVRVSTQLRDRMIIDFMEQIYKKDWLTINRFNTGDLSTRLFDDIQKIVNAVMRSISDIIALGLQVLMGFAFIYLYDPLLAILVFTLTPIAIFISLIIGTKLKKIQYHIQDKESELRSKTNESLLNLMILKTFNFTSQNKDEIASIQKQRYTLIKKRNTIRIKANLFMDLGYYAGFFLAIALGAYRLSNGAITIGMITALIQLVGRIQGPLEELSYEIPALVTSFSSVQRINEIFDVPDEMVSDDSISLKHIQSIRLRNIDFHYVETQPILKHISLQMDKGSRVGIVGGSGEGKTTLMNLILALLKPDSGDIIMDFTDGTSEKQSVLHRIYFSYVPQKNMLFSGTIRDNFFLDTDIDEDQIHLALESACAASFIQVLDKGLDTELLEDGLGLSQGQVQRLSIARALMHDRQILILDEATSSLDEDTERQLIHNIKINYPDKTLIAVTHKKPLLNICDVVFELKNGYIKKLS